MNILIHIRLYFINFWHRWFGRTQYQVLGRDNRNLKGGTRTRIVVTRRRSFIYGHYVNAKFYIQSANDDEWHLDYQHHRRPSYNSYKVNAEQAAYLWRLWTYAHAKATQ